MKVKRQQRQSFCVCGGTKQINAQKLVENVEQLKRKSFSMQREVLLFCRAQNTGA